MNFWRGTAQQHNDIELRSIENGRKLVNSFLLFSSRLLPKLAVLALLAVDPVRIGRWAWMPRVFGGPWVVLTTIIWSAAFPVPFEAYSAIALLDLLLSVALSIAVAITPYTAIRTLHPPAPTTLRHSLLGSAISLLIHLLLDYLIRSSFRKAPITIQSPHPSSSTTPSSKPSSSCHPGASPPTNPAPGTSHPLARQQSTARSLPHAPAHTPTTAAYCHTPAANGLQPSDTKPAVEAAPGRTAVLRTPYRSMCSTRHITAKINAPDAYQQRARILTSLEVHLQASFHSSHAGTLQQAPCTAALLLSTAAVRGCLQLLLRCTEIGAVTRGREVEEQLRLALEGFVQQLPPEMHSEPITLCVSAAAGSGDVLLRYGAAADGSAQADAAPGAGTEGGALAEGAGSGALGVAELRLEPMVLVAGGEEGLVVEVGVGQEGGRESAEVLVVVEGQEDAEVVVRHALEELECVDGMLRLPLPAHLPAGPVSVHLLSTSPGRQGVLLATTTTMALPPAAAAELALLHAAHAAQFPGHHGAADLLRDYAAAWQLPHADPPCSPAAASAVAAPLLDLLSDHGMAAARELLGAKLASLLPPATLRSTSNHHHPSTHASPADPACPPTSPASNPPVLRTVLCAVLRGGFAPASSERQYQAHLKQRTSLLDGIFGALQLFFYTLLSLRGQWLEHCVGLLHVTVHLLLYLRLVGARRQAANRQRVVALMLGALVVNGLPYLFRPLPPSFVALWRRRWPVIVVYRSIFSFTAQQAGFWATTFAASAFASIVATNLAPHFDTWALAVRTLSLVLLPATTSFGIDVYHRLSYARMEASGAHKK